MYVDVSVHVCANDEQGARAGAREQATEGPRETRRQRWRDRLTTRLTGVLSREAADAALASPVRCGCKFGDGSRVVTGAEDTPAAPLDTGWAACMHAACV